MKQLRIAVYSHSFRFRLEVHSVPDQPLGKLGIYLEATKKYRSLVSGKHLNLSYGKLKIFFHGLIVAKLICSIYCLGVFTTVPPSSNSVRQMMSKNRTACLKVRTSRGLIQ